MRIDEVIPGNNAMTCKFCDKACKSVNALRNHERLCPDNPDRNYVSHTKGIDPWNKGLTKDTDDRVAELAKLTSAALKGKPSKTIWTDDMRKAKSAWRKQLHIDHPETHPNRRLAGNRNKISYPEQVAFDYLTASGVKFDHQRKIGPYYPDFVIGNIIIEIDGANWHDAEKDKLRDELLAQYGFKVYRIDTKERIVERIKEILAVG